jgi:hypothetical protein
MDMVVVLVILACGGIAALLYLRYRSAPKYSALATNMTSVVEDDDEYDDTEDVSVAHTCPALHSTSGAPSDRPPSTPPHPSVRRISSTSNTETHHTQNIHRQASCPKMTW